LTAEELNDETKSGPATCADPSAQLDELPRIRIAITTASASTTRMAGIHIHVPIPPDMSEYQFITADPFCERRSRARLRRSDSRDEGAGPESPPDCLSRCHYEATGMTEGSSRKHDHERANVLASSRRQSISADNAEDSDVP
jgi:hypothetical protein